MKVPMLDIQAEHRAIRDELRAAMDAVLDSGAYIMGPPVAQLERELTEYLGVRHAIGVSSGTDAILIALHALDVGPGDLVLTTTYSFFATAGAVSRVGATPVFLDIDPVTCNLDPAALAAWFDVEREVRPRVKAIIPVHLYGQSADMAPIMEVARQHKVPVIEDAAQAIGATYRNQKCGTIGTIGAFSFFPSKNLGGIGDGGLVVTADDALADKMRCLRVHGAKPKYYHSMIGGNFRLDSIQAAVLRVKLPHLESWHAKRRQRAAYYDQRLADIAGVTLPSCVWGRDSHVYNQYAIHVDGDRDALASKLQDDGIATSIFYPVPFHMQVCFANLGYRRGDLPRSEHAAAHTLALPIYPELTAEMQDHVIDSIRRHIA